MTNSVGLYNYLWGYIPDKLHTVKDENCYFMPKLILEEHFSYDSTLMYYFKLINSQIRQDKK